jgi:hypothetical protein
VHFNLFLTPGSDPVVGVGNVMRMIAADEMGIQIDRLSKSEAVRWQEFLLQLIVPEEAASSGRKHW